MTVPERAQRLATEIDELADAIQFLTRHAKVPRAITVLDQAIKQRQDKLSKLLRGDGE